MHHKELQLQRSACWCQPAWHVSSQTDVFRGVVLLTPARHIYRKTNYIWLGRKLSPKEEQLSIIYHHPVWYAARMRTRRMHLIGHLVASDVGVITSLRTSEDLGGPLPLQHMCTTGQPFYWLMRTTTTGAKVMSAASSHQARGMQRWDADVLYNCVPTCKNRKPPQPGQRQWSALRSDIPEQGLKKRNLATQM